jgi:hypothetical protein
VSILPSPISLSRCLHKRREYFESELSTLCNQTARPRILAIGSTAVRDAENILPQIQSCGGELLFLDTQECLKAERNDVGSFHFIYAPNLVNQLADIPARRSVNRLASLLRRGGKLLVTNFSHDLADSQYHLQRTYFRSADEVARLSDDVPDAYVAGQLVWSEDSGGLVYLEISR